MEHTPNHPLSFRFLDDEAAIQWLAENETHIQTLLSCVCLLYTSDAADD